MQTTIANSGVLPAWLVLPITALLMLIIAGAITSAAKHTTPASRRRIRLANGWVMLLTTPLAATGFSLIDSSAQPRLFVKVWVLVIGLIFISIVLAILDMLNTARLVRLSHQRLRGAIRHPPAPASTPGPHEADTTSPPLRLSQEEDPGAGNRDDDRGDRGDRDD